MRVQSHELDYIHAYEYEYLFYRQNEHVLCLSLNTLTCLWEYDCNNLSQLVLQNFSKRGLTVTLSDAAVTTVTIGGQSVSRFV